MMERTRLVQMVKASLRLGRPLFSLATIVFGVETLLCAGLVDQTYSRKYDSPIEVVPVIPWLPSSLPWLAYVFGLAFAALGVTLLFERTLRTAAMVLGSMMILGAVICNAPNCAAHFGDMSIRTEVFEPLAIGALAWLLPGRGAIPPFLERTSRYFLAVSLIIFGVDHFLALAPIGTLIPNWIPWHIFWIAFFGAGFIAAGLSIAFDFLLPCGAACIGLMFALWVFTLHLPETLGVPHNPDAWSSLFIAVALWGGSWALSSSQVQSKVG